MSKSILILVSILLLAACKPSAGQTSADPGLSVVATTTIVGDVVSRIGGDLISLTVLLPVGTDPHSFDPTPKDVAMVSEADVVFVNGGGLEAFLDNLIESAGVEDVVVPVSEGVEFLTTGGEHDHGEDDAPENEHRAFDPHTWTDPSNVIIWVGNIRDKLVEMDPSNAATYQGNSEGYLAELQSLDTWIRDQVAEIPESERKFLADHGLFEYYAFAYGFEQVGTLIPGYTTLAEPSAQELAGIEDAIKTHGVKVILVGNTANPSLAERVSGDTGTRIVQVYTGSLSEPDGEAGTYLSYMRYNTRAIISALK
jgi:manganese/iron transport system substrate-binding protein